MAIPTFPTLIGLAWPVVRVPMWATLSQEATSGKTTTLKEQSFPRYQYTVDFEVLRTDASLLEFQTMQDFLNQLGGAFAPFYYNDPNDNAVVDMPFGTGDGVTTVFQLQRSLIAAGFSEPVQSPLAITNIKVSGTPTGAYTLGSAGLITFSSPPAGAAPLTWSGTFNWLCRFDLDKQTFSNLMQRWFELKKLSFTTVKL